MAPVDVRRAADLYAQGRTPRQIGAEVGVTATTVNQQLRRAGVTMRRGAPPPHVAIIIIIIIMSGKRPLGSSGE